MSRGAVIICAVAVIAAGAAVAAWRAGRPPAALPKAKCGTAVTHFLTASTQLLGADHGALTCFVTAARECRAASLGVTEMGVDTGTGHVFTIEPGGTACQVTERSQYYSANGRGSDGPVVTRSCRLAAVTGRGVRLRCGGQDVLIPATVSAGPSRTS